MTHISINTSNKLPMEELWRLTLRFCFDKNTVKWSEEKQMRESCFLWHKYIEEWKENRLRKYGVEFDPRPIGTKGTYIDEIEFYLGIICMHIEADDNERSWMMKRKVTYKEHGIDYKKAYKILGSWTKEDFVKAMKAQKKQMEENPEDYI